MGRGIGKSCIELLCAIILWLGFTCRLSTAQGLPPCWDDYLVCIQNNINGTTSSQFNDTSKPFNASAFYCCSLMYQQIQTQKLCFCSILPSLHQDPTKAKSAITFLSKCNVTDTLDSFDIFCQDDSTSASASAPNSDSPDQFVVPTSHGASSNWPPADVVTPPTAAKNESTSMSIILPVVIPPVMAVMLITTICIAYYCMRPNAKNKADVATSQNAAVTEDVLRSELPNPPPPPPPPAPTAVALDDLMTPESLQYELKDLQAATNDFSNDYKIGQGGFGVVYKGTLPNGREIAVKRLSNISGQGDKEFKNEVVLLAKLQHRNLVKLLGFCLAGDEQLLVYEYMPNKSLDYFLFDPQKQDQLNWPRHYNVIRGTARGVLYLHEDSPIQIIHRDLKAANILLDAEMNPKISDFGMARITQVEQTHIYTSHIVGTYGYMAPEYLVHGQFSVKSDVYSFGVLILEIVSGRRISGLIYQSGVGENLLSYAWRCWGDGRPLELMDPALRDSYSNDEVIRCIHLGLLCIQEEIHKRPTMATVGLMLSTVGALPLPQHPAFVYGRNSDQSTTTGSTTSSMPWSQNEGFITNKPGLR